MTSSEFVLSAPEQLGVETREVLLREALDLLGARADATTRLVIDFSGTHSVDTAGLGVLAAIHRRALELGVRVVLRAANEEVRFALVLAKLDSLIEIGEAA